MTHALERWGQDVRFAAMEGAPGTIAGDASGLLLNTTVADMMALLDGLTRKR